MAEYKTRQQKRKFYDSPEWKHPDYGVREKVKKRDNFECQECKRNGYVFIDTNDYSHSAKRKKIQLVVHHIKELEDHPELALEIDNLETLCVKCHNRIHGRIFKHQKPKWDDEKW